MEFEGTKGEWKAITHYKDGRDSKALSVEVTAWNGDSGVVISNEEVYEQHQLKQMQADAKLIASAPELLEALQGMVLMFEGIVRSSSNANQAKDFKCYQQAIEAINKALK